MTFPQTLAWYEWTLVQDLNSGHLFNFPGNDDSYANAPLQRLAQSAGEGAAKYTDYISENSCYDCPGYNTKQSDSEAPVILELWSIPSLPPLRGPLEPGELAPHWVLSMGDIELFDIQTVVIRNWIVWNRTVLYLTVCIQKSANA